MSLLQLRSTNHHGFQFSTEVTHVGDTLKLWSDRYRQRRELAQWSERELADIGLNQSAISGEVNKPFWQA